MSCRNSRKGKGRKRGDRMERDRMGWDEENIELTLERHTLDITK